MRFFLAGLSFACDFMIQHANLFLFAAID